uniref:Uncharacterized protein n=1 Tax=Rhizophora mucronata TaxID=61149 RepID=A0A2P2QG56_RHIMU
MSKNSNLCITNVIYYFGINHCQSCKSIIIPT